MNRSVLSLLVSASLSFASGRALAQSPPPDAGAAAEAFSPGPGGGEPDAGSRRPPLESTGLEDTDLGCSCRTAGAPAQPGLGLLAGALLLGAVRIANRARRRR
jgi:MYXO-CTERM domain-containing protein